MIDSYGRIVDGDPDDLDEPPECHCGARLPWEPSLDRRIVGYPGQKFVEVREYRTCPACGERHEDGGWYEELPEARP